MVLARLLRAASLLSRYNQEMARETNQSEDIPQIDLQHAYKLLRNLLGENQVTPEEILRNLGFACQGQILPIRRYSPGPQDWLTGGEEREQPSHPHDGPMRVKVAHAGKLGT
jgi:hypothetical protein